MTQTQPQFLAVGEHKHKRRIAYLSQKPESEREATGIIWLGGLKSDMVSTKATALEKWAPGNGFALTRFDYSGHGASDGVFEQTTIGNWLEEAHDVFIKLTTGPQFLIGSSTGGHIALLLLRDLLTNNRKEAARIKALILIAPAWDLTQELMWNTFPDDVKREIMEKGFYDFPSDYGEPLRISKNFIEEGRNHLFKRKPFNPGRPMVILQGGLDTSVPPRHSRELMEFLQGGWGQLIEVPDGDHSLSRQEDLELLFKTIIEQRESVAKG